jgi:ATPases of the AAA+ class
VTLSPPDEDELLEILHQNIDGYRATVAVEWQEPEFREAASILHGLTRMEAENVIATLVAAGAVRRQDLRELVRAKDRLFSDISGVERVELDRYSVDVGGLAGLRAWLERERPLLTADLRSRQLRLPRGVLLVGVPGCGKSLSARFVAQSWNLPLYRLDLANIHGMYLGQSESRLKDALASADHVAPCVLWIEEIEKGLAGAGSSHDGGTSTRLVGHFLFWLQEAKTRVFVVATANDVTSLPGRAPAPRAGSTRSSFVDLPMPDERREIISVYTRRNLAIPPAGTLLEELVEISDGYAGADIEAGVREVAKDAFLHGEHAVTPDAFRRHFRNIVPFVRTSPERVEAIRTWGRERALPASGQPISPTDGGRRPGRAVLV